MSTPSTSSTLQPAQNADPDLEQGELKGRSNPVRHKTSHPALISFMDLAWPQDSERVNHAASRNISGIVRAVRMPLTALGRAVSPRGPPPYRWNLPPDPPQITRLHPTLIAPGEP